MSTDQVNESAGQPTPALPRLRPDFGYSGHERGNEADDRVHRKAWPGQVLRSAYSATIGDTPTLAAGDVSGARSFLHRIDVALEKGGWTRNEWRRLYSMQRVWSLRAAGMDERFNLVGNRRTGVDRRIQVHVQTVNTIRSLQEALDDGRVRGK